MPETRRVVTLEGKWEEIVPELVSIRDAAEEISCRVLASDLAPLRLAAALEEVFAQRKHNYPIIARSLLSRPERERKTHSVKELRALTEEQVFELLLDRKGIDKPEEREELLHSFRRLLAEMREKEAQP